MPQIKVKDEAYYKLDWHKKDGPVRVIQEIGVLSLPTLQRLYLKHLKEDASECTNPQLLARKLQYWFQRKYYKYHEKVMPPALVQKTKIVLGLPITTPKEGTMKTATAKTEAAPATTGKIKKHKKVKVQEAKGPAPAATTEKPKRKGPGRTGEPHTVTIRGHKLHGKFLYEILVQLMPLNRKLKCSDHELAEAIRAGFPGLNYEDRRIAGERNMYNKGTIKGMTGVPEKLLHEYDEKGNRRIREIPEQLQPFVQKGKSVKQTIEENKQKGLIKAKPKVEKEEEEEENEEEE